MIAPSTALPTRFDGSTGFFPPRADIVTEEAIGETDFQTRIDELKKRVKSRRINAENLSRISSGIGKFNLATLLTGGATILADAYLHDFIPPDVSNNILNFGTLGLATGLAAQVGTGVASELVANPDKEYDKGVKRAMSLNKLGGIQATAKLIKWGANIAKWGALAVSGLAITEGLVGQDPLGGTLEMIHSNLDFLPNLPNIEPSMAFPAAALAGASEIVRRVYDFKDKMYNTAADYIRYDSSADKKKHKPVKETLTKNSGKMALASLVTGDIPQAILWWTQKQKTEYEGKSGPASATLTEFARQKAKLPEGLTLWLMKNSAWLAMLPGIIGLAAPALNGPLPAAMSSWVDGNPDFNPATDGAVWAGILLAGAGLHHCMLKPQYEFFKGMQNSTNLSVNSGRKKFVVGPTI